MRIKNFETATSDLRTHLVDYLSEKISGYQEGRNFRCINPAHEDKSPSMGLLPDKTGVHCFSCGACFSIFDCVHILENKPIAGPGFINETLPYLAEKYGIALEQAQLTEEEIYELDTYRAYKAVSDYITHADSNKAYEEAVAARQWKPDTLIEFNIGCIPSREKYFQHMETLGFNRRFLEEVDLVREDLFDNDKLIFTIKDEHGRPVGFAARNLSYTSDKVHGAKYCNQKHTGVRCNIYRKSERLFGLSHALSHKPKRGNKEIYIFEGYSDVTTAAQEGLHNCAALGGITLTAEQLQLLRKSGYYHIVLCLDGDQAGVTRTAETLDTVMGCHKDLKVEVLRLPDEMDPDDLIRAKGIKEFKKLKRWSAFEWRLSQFSLEENNDDICKAMIPLIVNESSYIEQDAQCKALAKATGVQVRVIEAEVKRLQNSKEAERSRDRQTELDDLILKIQKDPSGAEMALAEAESALYDIARRYNDDSFSEESCMSFLMERKDYEEKKDGSFSGFILGSRFKNLEQALSGEWKKDVWVCLASDENCGKTSLLTALAFDLANHTENNAVVIYHTNDDTKEQVLPKFICVAEGSKKLTLNEVMDPNYHCKGKSTQEDKDRMYEKRQAGYETLQTLIKNGRLIIKDANDGDSPVYSDRLIKYYKEKYPDRNVVYILDNFHRQSGGTAGKKDDERIKFKNLSKSCKSLATRNHICVITTMEYTKLQKGARASNNSLAETKQIAYDANLIIHLVNDMHEKGSETPLAHIAEVDGEKRRLPIVELNITKNKITAFKDRLWFKFYPSSSDFSVAEEKEIAGLLSKADEAEKQEEDSFLGK